MKFFIKDFFSKCDQIRSFLRIWSHLLKKSFMEDFTAGEGMCFSQMIGIYGSKKKANLLNMKFNNKMCIQNSVKYLRCSFSWK